MKIIHLYTLVSFFSMTAISHAQDGSQVKIGDQAPNFKLENIINYHTSEASLTDFKGKWLILDFWGPHCIPCVKAIPKMEEYQREFPDLNIMLIGTGGEEKIRTFYERREEQNHKMKLPCAIDTALYRLFQVQGIPHYVWIDDTGIIRAITYQSAVTKENIKKFINGTELSLPVKKASIEIPYDYNTPFLINGNGGEGNSLLRHSVLASYTEGIRPMTNISSLQHSNTEPRLLGLNISISSLYAMAYGDKFGFDMVPYSRVELEVKDPARVRYSSNYDWEKWKVDFAYCYELIVPEKDKEKKAL